MNTTTIETTETEQLAGNLLTIADAANAMSICRTKIYELMSTGRLQSVKIPGCRSRRIPLWAIERLLATGLTGGSNEWPDSAR